jgi:hypothetical protein
MQYNNAVLLVMKGIWDGIVGIVMHYRLDSLGIESLEGENFPCHPDQPQSPPSLLYNGYQVFTRGKVTGVWF